MRTAGASGFLVVSVAAVVVLVSGACGQAARSTQVTVTDVASVDGGRRHACATTEAGRVLCWGANLYGQLGSGSTDDSHGEPVAVALPGPATQVSAGDDFTCAVGGSGAVGCWGFNLEGQLGDGHTESISMVPVPVTGIDDAVAVSTGASHACALRRGGRLSCWGSGDRGQLGDGSVADRATPVEVDLEGVSAVVTGRAHTCALVEDGTVRCWGAGSLGQLGDGTLEDRSEPVTVPNLAATAIAAAGDRTCASTEGGSTLCWGAGGDVTALPVEVEALSKGSGPWRPVLGPGTLCGISTSGALSCSGVVDGDAPKGTVQGADGPVHRPVAGISFLGSQLCLVRPPDRVACTDGVPAET